MKRFKRYIYIKIITDFDTCKTNISHISHSNIKELSVFSDTALHTTVLAETCGNVSIKSIKRVYFNLPVALDEVHCCALQPSRQPNTEDFQG